MNWIESEVKTALECWNYKQQQKTNKNKLLILRTNCTSSIHIWTGNCEISISRKLQLKKKKLKKPTDKAVCQYISLYLIILPLWGFGRSYGLISPPAFLLEANEFTLTVTDSLHRKMTGLNEKVLLYCSLNNSKTRAVYSLHGIDY